MRKLLYNTIRQALLGILDENNQSVIRHVDLWNQQTVLPEQEQPFDTPAVFIEFHQIQWMPLSQALREASVQVALHVVTDSRSGSWSDAIEVFALLDTVNKQLHCLSAASSDGSYAIDSLTLVQSDTDHTFAELMDHLKTYSCHVTDASAHARNSHPPSSLSIHISTPISTPISDSSPQP